MIFDRDLFVGAFQEIFTLQRINEIYTLCYDKIETDNFLLYYRDDDYYIIHFDSGTIINWYKHLGRCNNVNKPDCTLDYLKYILEKLNEDIDEYFKED